MLRIADLFNNQNQFITKVQYMVNENDEKLLTIVPYGDDLKLNIDKNQKIILFSYSLEYTFYYSIRFREEKVLGGKHFYSFEVSAFSITVNQRNEYRHPTYQEALVQDKEYFNPIVILDKSRGGLKIESKKPLKGNKVLVIYNDKNNKPIHVNSSIQWRKYENGTFTYGLKNFQR